jgi:hypothetical protein
MAEQPFGLHAWVDESMRLSLDDKGAYVLAATVSDPAQADSVRNHLRSLVLPGQSRLHWHDEGDGRRSMIAREVAAHGLVSLVVVGIPVVRAKQERARRLCMQVLLPGLRAIGVHQVWYESRTQGLNQADARMVSALRGKRLLPHAMRVDPARPIEEPMLWVPDAVAGAVNAALGGNPQWLTAMSRSVSITEIALR